MTSISPAFSHEELQIMLVRRKKKMSMGPPYPKFPYNDAGYVCGLAGDTSLRQELEKMYQQDQQVGPSVAFRPTLSSPLPSAFVLGAERSNNPKEFLEEWFNNPCKGQEPNVEDLARACHANDLPHVFAVIVNWQMRHDDDIIKDWHKDIYDKHVAPLPHIHSLEECVAAFRLLRSLSSGTLGGISPFARKLDEWYLKCPSLEDALRFYIHSDPRLPKHFPNWHAWEDRRVLGETVSTSSCMSSSDAKSRLPRKI